MRKSAFENWKTKFEEMTGDEETGDTNIDITVIANSDGEAAEDAITAEKMADDAAAADAAEEAQEAAETEAEDLKELAAVIRRHGLNPGMVEMMNVLLPVHSLGIYLPATESLDAHGTNRSQAESVAAALEASSDSFWEKTKNTAKKIWQWIKDFVTKAISRLGSAESKVKRMGETLLKRQFSPNRNDKAKLPAYPEFFSPKDSTKIGKYSAAFKEMCAGAVKFANDMGSDQSWSQFANMKPEDIIAKYAGDKKNLELAGNLKITAGNGKNKSWSAEEKNSKFFDKDTVDVNESYFKSYQSGGDVYKDVLVAIELKEELGNLTKAAAIFEKQADKLAADKERHDAASRKLMHDGMNSVNTYSNIYRRVCTNMTKVINYTVSSYLAGGRVLIGCSVSEKSDIKYD